MSAWADYYRAVTELHQVAGAPSSRAVAELAGGGMSHTTVNDLLKGRRLSGKVLTRRLVEALGGDWESLEPLWLAANIEIHGMPTSEVPAPPSQPGSTVLGELIAIRTLLEKLVSEKAGPQC